MRWVAYAAAAQLAPERALALIKAVALGQDTEVAKRAVRLLAALNHNLETDQLMQFAKRPEEFGARSLSVAHKLAPWSTLAIMLKLAMHGERLEMLERDFELVLARSARNWQRNLMERAQLQEMLNELQGALSPSLPQLRWVMAALVKLAAKPLPLPFSSLPGRRSLLSVDNLVVAVDTVLRADAPLRRPLIVAEPEALTIAEMITSLRRGAWPAPRASPGARAIASLRLWNARSCRGVRADCRLAHGECGSP